jgi:FMN phosphatase YigB (HAD superfamily)
MDVGGARAAGLTAVLFDPYDDHVDEDVERISALTDLLPVPTTRRC